MMLATVFCITFVSPSAMGKPLYFAMFPWFLLWTWVFYNSTYVVSEKAVRQVRKGDFPFSLTVGMVPQIGSGDLIRGRLVITKEKLELYSKEGRGKAPCRLSWSLDVKEIRSLGIGSVLAGRKGIIFYLDEGDVRFVSSGVKKKKEAIVSALGWSSIPQKPQDVTVSGDASSAPSFTDLDKNS